jgi:hypothetical protein
MTSVGARVRSVVVAAAMLALPAVARAQVDCPELRTIDMTRQQIEMLRENRQAGIDRLPTAQHQRLALESLYRWYWHRVARLEAQRRAVEASCYNATRLRNEGPFTRQALPPEPVADDPFSPWRSPVPAGPQQQPAMYPPYARYPDPNWDPFAYTPPPPRRYPGQRVWTYRPYRRY